MIKSKLHQQQNLCNNNKVKTNNKCQKNDEVTTPQ